MYQSINEYQFKDAFRAIRPDNFSYEGLEILFNELEQYEEDTGEKIELDVIAICCDFSESSEDEVKQYYSLDEGEDVDEYLSQNTWVLGMHETDGKKYFIYRQF